MNTTLDIQIACRENQLPNREQFQQWVDKVLVSKLVPTEQLFELTIRLVNIEESQQLNLQYRAKDKPTNVLSFPFEVPDGVDLNLLGDLVICTDIVQSEAKQQNKALNDHWAHLVIHGCLHLLGFDHISDNEAEEMESLEVEFLADLGIKNPYEN